MLTDALFERCRFATDLVAPDLQYLAVLTLLALLLQLLGELGELEFATPVERAKLVRDDDGVNPLRIQQEVLQVFELLHDPGRPALLFLDPLL